MDLNEFVDVVSKMRNAQVSYFKTRSFEFLKRSKDLEREVDSMIERFTVRREICLRGWQMDEVDRRFILDVLEKCQFTFEYDMTRECLPEQTRDRRMKLAKMCLKARGYFMEVPKCG